MDAATRRLVRDRAGNRCEYCGLHQDHSPIAALQIEHIVPKKHGGGDEIENLGLACIDCNLGNGNIAGYDPQTLQLTELFHPRQLVWVEHFERQGPHIVGKTPIGRTSVEVLNMNSEDQVALRTMILAIRRSN